MPQLDLNTWASQIFWLIIAFTAMYVLMSTLVLPRMSSIVQRREQKISGDLKRAEELRHEAQNILEEYTESLQEARAEALSIIAEATVKINEEQNARIADFKEKTRKTTEASVAAVLKSKEDAMKEVDVMSVEIASDVLKKVAGIEASDADLKSALNETTADLKLVK